MRSAETPSTSQTLTALMPLLWLSLAFVAGIVLADLVSLAVLVWVLLAGITIVVAIVIRILFKHLSPSLFLLSLSFVALFLGAARCQYSIPTFDVHHVAYYNDREYDLLITGWLTEPPDYRDSYTNLRLQVTNVDTGDGDFKASGEILARVDANEIYQYGQIIRLRGKLATPPENEDFSYRDYLAAEGIHSYMSSAEATVLPGFKGNPIVAAIYAVKDKSLDNIYKMFPDPDASLLAGILLGVDTGLTNDLQQAFKDTGTAHIIAISGFNISIIAAIFVMFFSRFFGERRGALMAALGIALYTFIVGASAAVVRAALMGGLSLFARQVGRRQAGLNTLSFVAFLMALWNPLVIWDVGFQLSFFATLGLILYAEPFGKAADRIIARILPASTAEKATELFSEFVLLTLAAQLTTIPILAYHFKRIWLISFVSNPFILPAQPSVMILGGLAVLASWVALPIGQIMAWIAWPFLVYTIRMVELFDQFPHGIIFLGNSSIWFAIFFYAALLSLTFGWSRFKEWIASLRRDQAALPAGGVVVVLVVVMLIVWRVALAAPDGRLHITFMDVGSADAVLIETPSGRTVLINGGPSATVLSDELGRRLSLNRKIDWLVIGATDEEQVAALPRVLDRYPPQQVLWSGNEQASLSSRVLNEWLAQQDIPVTRAETGQVLDLGSGAALKLLHVGSRGSVILIEWDNFRALLPVGLSPNALIDLQHGASIGPVTVLSLADSGYAQSNPPDWIANLNPELIVLSVDAGDRNGMPDEETLKTIEGYSLLRTDQNGWIKVTTDGTRMWVDVERK